MENEIKKLIEKYEVKTTEEPSNENAKDKTN